MTKTICSTQGCQEYPSISVLQARKTLVSTDHFSVAHFAHAALAHTTRDDNADERGTWSACQKAASL